MSITWSKYFDRIYCINFIDYDKRKKLMQFELKRTGILDSGIFEWYTTYGNNLDKAYQKLIFNSFKTIYEKNPWTNVSAMFGHMGCIRDAIEKGYKHVLILEDDARFLKNLNQIEEVLDHRPEGYNIILYDKMLLRNVKKSQFKPINEYYSSFSFLYSAGCYQLDPKGMKRIIELFETIPQPIDNYFGCAFKELGEDIKACCSNTNLSIQIVFEDANNLKKIWKSARDVQSTYQTLGICFDNYMMRPSGAVYYYGDVIEVEEEKKEYDSLVKLTKDTPLDLSTPIQSTEMNICIGISYDVFERILPLIYTIKKFSKSKIHFHLILNTDNYRYLEQQIEKFKDDRTTFTFYNDTIVKNYLNPEYSIKPYTHMTYAKLIIPTLFPQYEKMLYLDYDVLIKNKGIEWLYNMDLGDNYLAAGRDIIDDFLSSIYPNSRVQSYMFQFKNKNYYFNAGVILFNIKKIIADGFDKKMLDVMQNFQTNHNNEILKKYYEAKFLDMVTSKKETITFRYHDQSLLNYVFMNQPIIIFNPIFNNLQTHPLYGSDTLLTNKKLKKRWGFEDQQELLNKTIIIHYAGQKPWWKDLENKDYFTSKYQQQLFNYYDNVIKEMEQTND